MKYKNVLIHGIHTVNLGDDLFFKIILNRYPECRFVIQAPEIYKTILSDYNNCIILSDTDSQISRLKKYARIFHLPVSVFLYFYLFVKYKIDIFLIAGGSLFIEGNSHVPKLVANIKKLSLFFPRLKISIIGSNFGPCTTDHFKRIVEKTILKLDDICFRDIQSYLEFSNLPNVRWANDLVMHEMPHRSKAKTKSICVNIRSVDNWPSLKPNKDRYLFNTKKIIELYQNQGYSITLLSFCERYGDNEITDELYNLIDSKTNIKRLYYKGNIDDCINAISSAELIIATRFHAIILGLIYRAKVVPISYSIKSENMLKTFGIWKPIHDYKSYCNSNITEVLNSAIDNFQVDSSNNTQFEYLDKILN